MDELENTEAQDLARLRSMIQEVKKHRLSLNRCSGILDNHSWCHSCALLDYLDLLDNKYGLAKSRIKPKPICVVHACESPPTGSLLVGQILVPVCSFHTDSAFANGVDQDKVLKALKGE